MKTGVRSDRLAPILLALPAHRAQGPRALTYINRVCRSYRPIQSRSVWAHLTLVQVSEGIRIFFWENDL
jgi:hypothetical protein